MEKYNSYAYFAFRGENLNPELITQRLKTEPTQSWSKGDKNEVGRTLDFGFWQLRSVQNEIFNVEKLVEEVVYSLEDKVGEINKLKLEFQLHTVLEIVLFIDTNEEKSTPRLGHELPVINFLYNTGTVTDIDMYRYDTRDN